jgi:hypothetical protein
MGKTTFIRSIMGLAPPLRSGTITWRGEGIFGCTTCDSICAGDTPGTQMFLCCRCKLGDRNPLGSPTKAAGRYSHPRSPNAERSTPGGAYHPPVR